jgi:excisionase family DNA binding protein
MIIQPTNCGNDPPLNTLLTRADVQRLLQLSGRTIKRLVAAHELPAPIRVGQSYRWRSEDLQTYLNSKT